jgi:hypothetical protein
MAAIWPSTKGGVRPSSSWTTAGLVLLAHFLGLARAQVLATAKAKAKAKARARARKGDGR